MARLFNGTSDSISVGSQSALQPAAITISFWIYIIAFPSGTNNTYINLENAGNTGSIYFIGQSSSPTTKLAYYFSNSSVGVDPGTATLSTNTWYHVLATYTTAGNAGINAFVNGVSDGSTASSSAMGTSTAATTFGAAFSPSFNKGAHARIADVAIWNVVLSAAEISALAIGARPYTIREPSLAGYWPLDGIESPEPDLSGNAFNGTLTGTTLASGPPLAMFTPRWPLFSPPPVIPPVPTVPNLPLGLASCEW